MTALALRQVPLLPMVLRRNYGNTDGSVRFGCEMTVVGLGFGRNYGRGCFVYVWGYHFWLSRWMMDHKKRKLQKGSRLKAGFMGAHVGRQKDSPFDFVFLDSFCFTRNF